VFAALHEDTDKGWVWLRLDPKRGFLSRSTILIRRGDRSVYCEHRNFDKNFVRKYDASEDTHCIYFPDKTAARERGPVDLGAVSDVIVMSGWYRSALGGFETEGFGGEEQQLEILKPRFSGWADLRAACQHPEPIVRIATRLAILGTWLGVAALLLAFAVVKPVNSLLEQYVEYPELAALGLAAAFGVLCVYTGRGVARNAAQYARKRTTPPGE
jgi:hypothetical protein